MSAIFQRLLWLLSGEKKINKAFLNHEWRSRSNHSVTEVQAWLTWHPHENIPDTKQWSCPVPQQDFSDYVPEGSPCTHSPTAKIIFVFLLISLHRGNHMGIKFPRVAQFFASKTRAPRSEMEPWRCILQPNCFHPLVREPHVLSGKKKTPGGLRLKFSIWSVLNAIYWVKQLRVHGIAIWDVKYLYSYYVWKKVSLDIKKKKKIGKHRPSQHIYTLWVFHKFFPRINLQSQ